MFLFHPLFHPFGDHMVGDTAERLQTQHIRNAVFNHAVDFTGDEPPFAVLMGEPHNLFRFVGDMLDGVHRAVIVEILQHAVHFIQK